MSPTIIWKLVDFNPNIDLSSTPEILILPILTFLTLPLDAYSSISIFFYENDVIEKLKKFDLFSLKERMVSSLSGGERQRIAIIKECLFSFDILLCDEITSALDKDNAIKIIDFILNVFKDKTIIFISHDESLFTNKIDHIIKINDKKIVEDKIINKIEHR